MRKGERKIFVCLWVFLELFMTLNSGHAKRAKCQKDLFSFGFLKFHFVSQYNLLHTYTKSIEVFERTDRKISGKGKIGRTRFRGVIMLVFILQKHCAQRIE
jgi:hypothetical protein